MAPPADDAPLFGPPAPRSEQGNGTAAVAAGDRVAPVPRAVAVTDGGPAEKPGAEGPFLFGSASGPDAEAPLFSPARRPAAPSAPSPDAPAPGRAARRIDVDGSGSSGAPPWQNAGPGATGAPPPGPQPPGAPPAGPQPPGTVPPGASAAAPGLPGAAATTTTGSASAAPSTPLAVKAGRLVGRVDGEISLDMETHLLRGVLVLVVGGLLAVAIVVLKTVASVTANLPHVIGSLLPAVLVVGALLLLVGMAFGASPRRLLGGAGRAARGAAASGARAAARGAARGTVGGMRGGARMTASSSHLSTMVTLRRFRVRALTGELVSCVQQGELLGDEIRHGDYVLVEGRRARAGHLLVKRAEVLQGPAGPTLSVVQTRRTSAVAVAGDRIALVLGLALLAWSIVEVARMVG